MPQSSLPRNEENNGTYTQIVGGINNCYLEST